MADILLNATTRLRAAGVESPRREARLLLAHTLGVRPEDVVSGNLPSPSAEAWNRFETALARRAAREPLAYITGSREFWSLDFEVGPGVLVPRPESEIMVEEALKRFPLSDAPLRVVDLGTGSGCLLLAFLSERPNAEGLGVDISSEALAVAKRNAEKLGLINRTRFLRGDWTGALSEKWDVVFVNPPYIAQGDLAGLEPEVGRYEPRTALDGGPDGLAAYRRIAAALRLQLRPGGLAFLEVGQGQAKPVESLLAEKGLEVEGTVFDLASIPRCLVVIAEPAKITGKKELAIGTRSG
ncbi:MAG TPA: peptide chain release factor N(5)-glutamine methyltransferase [Micropepsaceae bacterium]|nr:peptide chain release factor N(5)-glutamine methyltransferase [Micropepsaceae bacterium]